MTAPDATVAALIAEAREIHDQGEAHPERCSARGIWWPCPTARLADALEAAQRDTARLKSAIVWALGYTNFEEPPGNRKPYWWRSQLRALSGLGNEECQSIGDAARAQEGGA